LQRKGVQDVIKAIKTFSKDKPDAGTRRLGTLSDAQPVGLDETTAGILPSFESHINAVRNEKQNAGYKSQELFYVVSTDKHTTSFFSRTNAQGEKFYYLIDSADPYWQGKMEIYD